MRGKVHARVRVRTRMFPCRGTPPCLWCLPPLPGPHLLVLLLLPDPYLLPLFPVSLLLLLSRFLIQVLSFLSRFPPSFFLLRTVSLPPPFL